MSEKKVQRLRLRWLNKLYANLFGYFWLPCPICGRDFGGHEWLPENVLMIDWTDSKGVCPNCGEEAKRRNKEYVDSHPLCAVVVGYNSQVEKDRDKNGQGSW